MAAVGPEQFRNVVLVGHGGAGKTSLAEALLFKAGATKRLGSVPDGTSVLDFSDEAKERKCSLESSVCCLEHGGAHVNIIDTPGAMDFCGQAIPALAAAETAIVVVSAAAGVEVNTRKMFQRAKSYGLGMMIVVTKIDGDVNLSELLDLLKASFGNECTPLTLPTGGGEGVVDCLANESGDADFDDVATAHEALLEAIVGADDKLMEAYLGGEVDLDAIRKAAPRAVAAGTVVPVLFVNNRGDVGIDAVLNAIVQLCPSPVDGKRREMTVGEAKVAVEPSADGPFVGQVFKVAADPRSNIKYSVLRVHRGKLTPTTALHSTSEHKGLRPGQANRCFGAEHREVDEGVAGDIVALAKLDLSAGDVLFSDKGGEIEMPAIPAPMFAVAIEPKSRGDEEKVSVALKRYTEEDPCFQVERVAATHELVIRGVGDNHLRTILQRMHKQFKLDVDTKPPKVPYRETITGRAKDIDYTHKKQTGGAGQYGKVVINLEPNERGKGYEFIDKIFGGAIDGPFRVSADKGIRAQLVEGVIAGYPVVDVKVELIDGKTHAVDSKDIAFQIAGRGAFKEAFLKSNPVLLEPIVHLEVTVPNDCVGDVQGDLASRRGRPHGQEMLPGNFALIKATVPLSELSDYSSRLASIAAGQGSYSMEFSHYEQVPGSIQQQLIAEHAKARHAE